MGVRSSEVKELAALLDAFDGQDAHDIQHFRDLLERIPGEAIPELGRRLIRPSTSRPLKRLILASPGRHPRPEWTPALLRALLHETDPELFEEGCRALVQIGGVEETDALRQIAQQRQDPELQAIVSRKLAFLEPRQPFSYHFRDLLAGSRNPRLSGQAAAHLAAGITLADLGELEKACDHPDNVASIHALQVIAAIQHPEAARFLLRRFEDAVSALMEDIWFRSAHEQIKRAAPQSVRVVVLDLLRSCPGAESHAEALAAIERSFDDSAADPLSLVQRLQADLQGLRESRLLDCLADLALDRPARASNLLPEPPEELRVRTQRLQGIVDTCAEGLARFMRRGILEKREVLPPFQRACEAGAGGDGFGRSFAEILDDEDMDRMELILAAVNHHWRRDGITVLGERKRPVLLSFFLRAMADPIVENAHLAIRYLGGLPGAFEAAMEFFRSDKADQMECALQIFSLSAMAAAGPVLVDYLEKAEREDLLIGAVQCLGILKHGPAVEPLLGLLRGGQPPRLQRAVAESLAAFDIPDAALGLLQKALDVRNPDILIVAIEGIARLRNDVDRALSPEEGQLVERLLDVCFDEGGGVKVRAIAASQGLWSLDDAWFERLERRIGEAMAEQRKRPTWDRDQQQAVASALRELERKRRELARLSSSAKGMRELIAGHVPGPKGVETLRRIGAALGDPGLSLGPDVRGELEAWVGSELERRGTNEEALEWLCRLAAKLESPGLQGPLTDLLARTNPRSMLRRLCLEALRAAGCAEEAVAVQPPVREILVLDPSAFFRKRLAGIAQGCTVREAQGREEAQALLDQSPVDLLISESADPSGSLLDWFAACWRDRKVRQVILSTNSRSLPDLAKKPWHAATLVKPYPMEDLLGLLGK